MRISKMLFYSIMQTCKTYTIYHIFQLSHHL
nr:MAG TPA_asm: hypothetical protein [Bacteriophage sp.]